MARHCFRWWIVLWMVLLVLPAFPLLAAPDQDRDEEAAGKPRNIVLCLDGTWNSTYDEAQRDDGSKVLKPTNVLKLCRSVEPRGPKNGREQIAFYQTGVGSLPEYPGVPNRLLHVSDKLLGGAYGAGFEANVEDALEFLVLNHRPGDKVFIFGFSRGAATARAVTRFIGWAQGLPSKDDAYYLPVLFREFVSSKGEAKIKKVLDKINNPDSKPASGKEQEPPRQRLKPLKKIEVDYLGVWDTVMALGARFKAKGASTASPSQSFYVDRQPAPCVRHARQALAVDEARYDFRPEVWTGHADDQKLEQHWFVGVHSNVGGGYVKDGLANLTFRWVLKGAEEHGLEVDLDFVKHYPGFPGATIYDSGSTLYRALDKLRGRSGRGRRCLAGRPESANLSLDPSVIERMELDPAKLAGKAYRPENVLLFLACQPDLDRYLAGLDLKSDETRLPPDVLKRIAELRPQCGRSIKSCD
jgi:uncharacterized protein (DUF2235 family)